MNLPQRNRRLFRPVSGFTLVELLVILVLVSVISAVVLLNSRGFESGAPETERERMAAVIRAQCDQALLSARVTGMRLHSGGYDFWQRFGENWQRLDREPLAPHAWPRGLTIAGRVGATPLDRSADPPAPQILCTPMGEVSPFAVRLVRNGNQAVLAMDAFGTRMQGED